jgi:hypothetical protein
MRGHMNINYLINISVLINIDPDPDDLKDEELLA